MQLNLSTYFRYRPIFIEINETTICQLVLDSDAATGWAGSALAHPEFGSSVNSITTRGADYAHRITACPPRFENLAASLHDI